MMDSLLHEIIKEGWRASQQGRRRVQMLHDLSKMVVWPCIKQLLTL